MKKIYLVLAILAITLMTGFFACDSATGPSTNNEGITVITCKPSGSNTLLLSSNYKL